jgi:hypothetical protein
MGSIDNTPYAENIEDKPASVVEETVKLFQLKC